MLWLLISYALMGVGPATAQQTSCPKTYDGYGCIALNPFRDRKTQVIIVEGHPPDRGLFLSIRYNGNWFSLPPFPANDIFVHTDMPMIRSGVPRKDLVATADVEGHGREDMIVLADCANGPDTQRFPYVAVYRNLGMGKFEVDQQLDDRLNDDPDMDCLRPSGCDLVKLVIGKRQS